MELLIGALVLLIFLSAFFSSSETAMMALNRYRLRHMAKNNHRGALRATRLLRRPDRLIGVILIGNNFVNILASSIATVLAIRLWGDAGIAIATGLLTLVILIFAEVTPKTLAALHPESIAFPASIPLKILLFLLYPFVWFVNAISNGLLRCIGVRADQIKEEALNADELRSVVHESGKNLPVKRQGMLLGVLDLEKVSVNDIMVPRNEIIGIDIEDPIEQITSQLHSCEYTRIPVYNEDINNVIGVLHMRSAVHLLLRNNIDKAALLKACDEPYFVPESTPLHTQLFNFQQAKQRAAIVVDEYGDVEGLVTLEDILEEIVGEFTTDIDDDGEDIKQQDDGSVLVDGSLTIRELNKAQHWELPTQGPKTLNGLITEILEEIPESPVCLHSGRYRIEILTLSENRVQQARISTTP